MSLWKMLEPLLPGWASHGSRASRQSCSSGSLFSCSHRHCCFPLALRPLKSSAALSVPEAWMLQETGTCSVPEVCRSPAWAGKHRWGPDHQPGLRRRIDASWPRCGWSVCQLVSLHLSMRSVSALCPSIYHLIDLVKRSCCC